MLRSQWDRAVKCLQFVLDISKPGRTKWSRLSSNSKNATTLSAALRSSRRPQNKSGPLFRPDLHPARAAKGEMECV
jgi:hypothetical protein